MAHNNHSCEANAFNKSDATQPVHESLLEAVLHYFSAGVTDPSQKVYQTSLPPIYFQHPGTPTIPLPPLSPLPHPPQHPADPPRPLPHRRRARDPQKRRRQPPRPRPHVQDLARHLPPDRRPLPRSLPGEPPQGISPRQLVSAEVQQF